VNVTGDCNGCHSAGPQSEFTTNGNPYTRLGTEWAVLGCNPGKHRDVFGRRLRFRRLPHAYFAVAHHLAQPDA
jgi:hypothetical protein